MNSKRIAVVAAALLICASAVPARAQGTRTLELSFNDGRVTLVAENVTLREILEEWARKGGSRMVNAEKIGGGPVLRTQFESQPEAEVLRTLLREVPGYGASMREVTQAGASTVEAVFILATRSAAVPAGPQRSVGVAPPRPTAEQAAAFEALAGTPQAAPRMIQGSPDSEIPPVRPIVGNEPPMIPGRTPGSTTSQPANPNLRTGPDGRVTSTVPGVIIPVQGVPPGSGAKPPTTTGGRGRGGGGGGGGR